MLDVPNGRDRFRGDRRGQPAGVAAVNWMIAEETALDELSRDLPTGAGSRRVINLQLAQTPGDAEAIVAGWADPSA